MSDELVERLRYYADLASAVAEECKAMAEAADEIERLRRANGAWQSIENAPKDGSSVVLWGQFSLPEFGGPEALVGSYERDGWHVPDTQTGGFFKSSPTHWMPLLKGPE